MRLGLVLRPGRLGHWRATDQYDTEKQIAPKRDMERHERPIREMTRRFLLARDWGQVGLGFRIAGDGLDDCEAVHGDSAVQVLLE